MKTRIIAKLDVKPPNVVKPIMFEGLRVIGTPHELVENYYQQGADEIFYIDIVASLYEREFIPQHIQDSADKLFVPFGVGGGIRTIQDISKLFDIGADKVVINSSALQEDATIIDEAAKIFGSQAIVVNIEAKKWDYWWECYSDGGRVQSFKDVLKWTKEVEQRGAGEILLQSIDNDGLQKGFDLELCKNVVQNVNIPVVVASGAGDLKDIKNVIEYANPSGVAISSLLHFNKVTIKEIKEYLMKNNIKVCL